MILHAWPRFSGYAPDTGFQVAEQVTASKYMPMLCKEDGYKGNCCCNDYGHFLILLLNSNSGRQNPVLQ